MLTFDGERGLPLPPQQLWPKMRDAAFLVQCIPDGTVAGTPTRDHAECSVRPGLSFVRGSLESTIDILAASEPSSVKIQLGSKGVGTSSEVVVHLAIEAKDETSWIKYHAEVTRLGGLLKAIPGGLIRGAAQKIIEQVWENVGKRLEG